MSFMAVKTYNQNSISSNKNSDVTIATKVYMTGVQDPNDNGDPLL